MKKQILTYRSIIQRDGKGYHGFVPALLGCHTYGANIEEVRKFLRQAISAWIESRNSHGWSIPVDDTLETLESVEITPVLTDNDKLSYA